MNGKKAKQLRKKSKILLASWLNSIAPSDEQEINLKNLESYLPNETHVFINNRYLLNAFSLRWVYKKLKKNPNLTVEELQKDLLI